MKNWKSYLGICLSFLIIILVHLFWWGVYPYEYIDEWGKSNEKSLPKKDFHSNLNIENITDLDYNHAKRVCKDFEIK